MVDFKANAQGGTGTLSIIYSDGDTKTLQSTHPAYTEVLTYLVANTEHDEEWLREATNPALRLGRALKAVDPLYDYDLYTLSYDGLPLGGPLAVLIKDRLSSGSDWERFAKFAARLESNPSYRAKQALYTFIEGKRLTILNDGRFVGHKSVNKDGLSAHRGPNNFINGVLYGQPGVPVQVPHAVGTVVSKRRGDVDDSSMACSTGLHVGSHSYATGFSDVLLTVAVAPEDVVGGEFDWKFRTERYEVLGFNEDGSDFVSDDYDLVDRSDSLGEAEKRFAVNAALFSHEPVNFEFAEGEKAEFNNLASTGRNLYLNLRNLLAKTHRVAFDTALTEHGAWQDFLAKQETERAAQAAADAEAAAAAEQVAQADAEARVEKQVEAEEQVKAETTAQTLTSTLDLASLSTMDEKASASSDLRRDLLNPKVGHKPLARKWESAGVSETSVRRWRKANDVHLTVGTAIKGAFS